MKILIYGAGVIGTLYAAKLQDCGHTVTVLARGRRLADIQRFGLALENVVDGVSSSTAVETIDRLTPDDRYDLALVTVRRDQLAGVTPDLEANPRIGTVLFMTNNPTGAGDLADRLGQHRVLFGFPGAGGALDGHLVRYALIPQQATTLGELRGRRTPDLRRVEAAFQAAGFRVGLTGDIDAWLKTHAFFVTAVCGAIYLAGGDCGRLSQDTATLTLMSRGVREGFAAMRALGLGVRPFPLRILFTWLPARFAVIYWRRFFVEKMADYVFGRHARAAPDEMRALADDCRTLLEQSGVTAGALKVLYSAIEAYRARA